MPSIADLFGVSPEGTEGTESPDFDIQAMLDHADEIIASRPSSMEMANGALHQETPDPEEPEPLPPAAEVEPVEPVAAPEPVVPRETSDPLSELPPERRAAMLAVDQILASDPEKRQAIFGILNGAPAPAAAPEPQLPEDVDPNSFEATLWRQQNETQRQMAAISQSLRDQAAQTQQQVAANHAMTAARQFGAAHPELEEADVYEIARYAGNSGVAGAFVEANRSDPVGQLEQAFESVLYANEGFRSKVIAGAPSIAPADMPESVERKKKLTAVSSGASPAANGPARAAQLETRPDGRLTPASRQEAVKQVTAGLLRQRQGY